MLAFSGIRPLHVNGANNRIVASTHNSKTWLLTGPRDSPIGKVNSCKMYICVCRRHAPQNWRGRKGNQSIPLAVMLLSIASLAHSVIRGTRELLCFSRAKPCSPYTANTFSQRNLLDSSVTEKSTLRNSPPPESSSLASTLLSSIDYPPVGNTNRLYAPLANQQYDLSHDIDVDGIRQNSLIVLKESLLPSANNCTDPEPTGLNHRQYAEIIKKQDTERSAYLEPIELIHHTESATQQSAEQAVTGSSPDHDFTSRKVPSAVPYIYFLPSAERAVRHTIFFFAQDGVSSGTIEEIYKELGEEEIKLFGLTYWCFNANYSEEGGAEYLKFVKDSVQSLTIPRIILGQMLQNAVNCKAFNVDPQIKKGTEAWRTQELSLQSDWIYMMVRESAFKFEF